MMTQREFWELPEVRAQQEIQKVNPYGTEADINAFNEIKRLCGFHMGADFAQEYMGDYDD